MIVFLGVRLTNRFPKKPTKTTIEKKMGTTMGTTRCWRYSECSSSLDIVDDSCDDNVDVDVDVDVGDSVVLKSV